MRKTGARRRSAVNPMAGLAAITRMSAAQSNAPLAAQDVTSLAHGYYGAVDAVRRGRGTSEDANTLAIASNVTMLLADIGIGGDCMEDIKLGQAAIVVLMERASKTGRHVFDGPGLRAVNTMLEIHDQQLAAEQCTSGVMVGVLAELRRRLNAGDVIKVERIAA